jgi:glycosyltransferase involved in cell wall biosynthesis
VSYPLGRRKLLCLSLSQKLLRRGFRRADCPEPALRRVLWITLGGRLVASSRVRAFAISDELLAEGVPSACIPGRGARGRGRVLVFLARHPRPTIVVVQKILYGPLMLRLLRRAARVLVWECDDALQLGYPDADTAQTIRDRTRLARTLECVDVVTTSNALLATDLAPRSRQVAAFIGPSPPWSSESAVRRPVVLWLGSSSTQPYLQEMGAAPRMLHAAGWECVAVGANPRVGALGWRAVEWSPDAQAHWLSIALVGVMPQPRDPWADRKQGYKLLEYAAHGVVPVASDVGPARAVLQSTALKSLLVGDSDDWSRVILRAANNRAALLPHIRAVARRYDVASTVATWRAAVTPLLRQ